jgi:hypothetical protein
MITKTSEEAPAFKAGASSGAREYFNVLYFSHGTNPQNTFRADPRTIGEETNS